MVEFVFLRYFQWVMLKIVFEYAFDKVIHKLDHDLEIVTVFALMNDEHRRRMLVNNKWKLIFY